MSLPHSVGGDLSDRSVGVRLAERLDARLCQLNIEYAAKRESERLGRVRLEVVPTGFWQKWDRERLRQTGGTLEQYKHPCLINVAQLRGRMRQEALATDFNGQCPAAASTLPPAAGIPSGALAGTAPGRNRHERTRGISAASWAGRHRRRPWPEGGR
jgi:hypothetical protein